MIHILLFSVGFIALSPSSTIQFFPSSHLVNVHGQESDGNLADQMKIRSINIFRYFGLTVFNFFVNIFGTDGDRDQLFAPGKNMEICKNDIFIGIFEDKYSVSYKICIVQQRYKQAGWLQRKLACWNSKIGRVKIGQCGTIDQVKFIVWWKPGFKLHVLKLLPGIKMV